MSIEVDIGGSMSKGRYNNDNEEYDRSVVESGDDNYRAIGEVAEEILRRQLIAEQLEINFHDGNDTQH
jgi:hypothetical protein